MEGYKSISSEDVAIAQHSSTASVDEALLELLARQSQRVPVPVFLAAAFIGAITYDALGSTFLAVWLGSVLLVLALRYSVLGSLPAQQHRSIAARLRVATLLSAINGSVHAVPLVFFFSLPDLERTMVTVTLLGLGTGSVVTTAGYRPVFAAYLVPTLAPLIVLWGINLPDGPQWQEISFAVLLMLFGAILLVVATDTFRQFRESFEIRLEQVALNRQLRGALADSEKANSAKTRFLAAASHDLRQPIHALNLFTGALSRRPLDDKTREIADHLKLAVEMFDVQLDALLDVSKLDAGVVEVTIEPVNLSELAGRAKKQFEALATTKGLALSVECPTDIFGHTDETHLERIVGNLLSNAIKYTDSGYVALKIEPAATGYLIGVSDSGRGIPKHEQERIYEEFYQLENPSRDRSKGLGLGLAIAKRLVGLLDLELALESQLGEGTIFTLIVPRAEAPPSKTDCDHVSTTLTGLSILAVDDEAEVTMSLKFSLESQGCVVDTAPSTVAAVKAAEHRCPDILICDFRLTGDDNGIRTVEAVRAVCPNLPAILITGDTAPDRLREAAAANLKLMHKPVSDNELALAISEACDRKGDGHG